MRYFWDMSISTKQYIRNPILRTVEESQTSRVTWHLSPAIGHCSFLPHIWGKERALHVNVEMRENKSPRLFGYSGYYVWLSTLSGRSSDRITLGWKILRSENTMMYLLFDWLYIGKNRRQELNSTKFSAKGNVRTVDRARLIMCGLFSGNITIIFKEYFRDCAADRSAPCMRPWKHACIAFANTSPALPGDEVYSGWLFPRHLPTAPSHGTFSLVLCIGDTCTVSMYRQYFRFYWEYVVSVRFNEIGDGPTTDGNGAGIKKMIIRYPPSYLNAARF